MLAWATEDFGRRGFESARLDAELLLGHALNLSRIQLITESTRPLSNRELSGYRELIKRRRTGEPIAYILGFREFYGVSLRVSPAVLIPRPDTECLVEVALSRTASSHMFGRGLDLCTGSGCVAIALATRRPTWKFTGSDVSAAALAIAVENALRSGVAFSVSFVESDVFENIAGANAYDLITVNPPYIPGDQIAELPESIREFEPELALSGGTDGLSIVRSIIEAAPAHLRQGGLLASEVGFAQAESVVELFRTRGFEDVEVASDYGGNERVVSGRWPNRSRAG